MYSIDVPSCYNDKPRRSVNLDSSYKIESKTRQYPFVVASEIDNTNKITDGEDELGTREFYVFHDIEHFLHLKHEYPHVHEIIRTPSTCDYSGGLSKKSYRDDLCKGRLILDFDLKEPMTKDCIPIAVSGDPRTLVPPNFKQVIEWLILKVFETFYVKLDHSKFLFVWQVSRSKEKFSMHLIVKNAFFSEYWVKQMKIFYELMKRLAYHNDIFDYTKPIDFQIPHRNSTFRMIGASKINGPPLEFESSTPPLSEISIYDCLVGVYNHIHLEQEQMITMDNINYDELEDHIQESLQCISSPLEDGFRKTIEKNLTLIEDEIKVDILDADVEKAIKLFNSWDDGSFEIRDCVQNIINLNRVKRSACKISGVIHDRENAYLKLGDDGYLKFICRRGCNCNGHYSVSIGSYKVIKKREAGQIPINKKMVDRVKTASTAVAPIVIPLKKSTEGLYSKQKTSARKQSIGINVVQIPAHLKKSGSCMQPRPHFSQIKSALFY